MLLLKMAGERFVVRDEMPFRPAPEYEVWEADAGCVSQERYAATRDDEYLGERDSIRCSLFEVDVRVEEIWFSGPHTATPTQSTSLTPNR